MKTTTTRSNNNPWTNETTHKLVFILLALSLVVPYRFRLATTRDKRQDTSLTVNRHHPATSPGSGRFEVVSLEIDAIESIGKCCGRSELRLKWFCAFVVVVPDLSLEKQIRSSLFIYILGGSVRFLKHMLKSGSLQSASCSWGISCPHEYV